MARAKRAMLVDIPEEVPETESEGMTIEEVESEEILAEARSEQPRHPYDIVYKIDEATGEEAWAGKYAASVVTGEFLSKQLGPGKYKCYTRGPGKGGKMAFRGSRTIRVAADLRTATPVVARESGTGDFSRDLLISMMKQSTENSQNMVTMMATMMTAMTTAMTSLKPTADPMMGAVIQGMMGRKDPTEIATQLLGVMRESGATAKDPIEQLKQLLEVRELLGGGAEPQDPETSMILKGMETLQQLFQGGRAFQPPPVVPAAPVPVRALSAAPAPVASPVPEERTAMAIDPNMRAWKRGVAASLPMLLQAASFMPPHAAAETAEGQMQDAGVWPDLVEDVRSDYPTLDVTALPDDFGAAFVERTMRDLHLETLPADALDWVRETLYELAQLAVEPEDADEEASP